MRGCMWRLKLGQPGRNAVALDQASTMDRGERLGLLDSRAALCQDRALLPWST